MTNSERLVTKVTSGQFILTVSSAAVFAYLAIAGMIGTETTTAILMMVFVSYFKRDRPDPKPDDPELSNRA